MRPLTALTFALVASMTLSAQQSYYISPPGTESIEGNSASSIQLDYANSRIQQIDNSLVGTKLRLIRGIAYRRDGGVKVATKSTIEIEFLMTHANFSMITSTYAKNYLKTPTVVFKKKKVSIDWTQTPKSLGQYDAVFPFDKPFIYNSKDALLWDSKTTTGTRGPGLKQDWFSGNAPGTIYGPKPSTLGTGCKTSNGTMTLGSKFQSSSSTGFDFAFELKGGPSTQPALLIFGLGAASIPLFCGKLEISSPVAILSFGATSSTGAIPFKFGSMAWNSNIRDANIYTQVLALDKKQSSGFALSNGLHSRVMRSPGGARAHAIKRIYSTSSSTATSGSTPSLSSVATKYLR